MSDITESSQPRERSPAFPSVPLETALRRLAEFENHFKRMPARPEKIGDAWQMKAGGSVDRIAAALRYFGLLEYQGAGTTARQVIVSDEGRKYLRSYQESTKREVIKAAALRPKQIALFWELWGKARPADAACLDELIHKHGFSDSGARDFLRVYDATISFAALSDSDRIQIIEQEENEASMAPAGQGTTVQRSVDPGAVANRLLDEVVTSVQYSKAKSPILQEIFNLDEGPVTLSFPSGLSPASFQDLQSYLQLFLRKAQRRAGVGDYFAETYAPDGIKAKEVHYFDGFHDLKRFVDQFKERASTDVLRVHLPARATDDERRLMAESGAVPV